MEKKKKFPCSAPLFCLLFSSYSSRAQVSYPMNNVLPNWFFNRHGELVSQKKLKYQKKEDSEEIMRMNGVKVLEKLISSSKSKYNLIRSFSAKELKAATNNYDTSKVITNDYKLWEGFLQKRPISVMKFETFSNPDLATKNCTNFIVFASHKNVLMLIGCGLGIEILIIFFLIFSKRHSCWSYSWPSIKPVWLLRLCYMRCGTTRGVHREKLKNMERRHVFSRTVLK